MWLGITYGSVQSVITKYLFMRRMLAKFVPKLLSDQQKENRKEISQEMLKCASQDQNFMNTIITGNETWAYSYDPETKLQSSQWKQPSLPRPKKVRQVRNSVKLSMTCFYCYKGIVHHEYAPQGQTFNKEYYLGVLRHFHEAVRQK
uniref:Uncharacterized protein n=1 Tax=Scylla olivacea TaxID=85551 RepID=A0A0P4VYL2_SCYOL